MGFKKFKILITQHLNGPLVHRKVEGGNLSKHPVKGQCPEFTYRIGWKDMEFFLLFKSV